MSGIEIVGEPRPEKGQAKVCCPWCKKIMMADLSLYTIDMSKPIHSNCPYCGGSIYTAMIIISHKTIPQLGRTLSIVIQAVEEEANPLNPDSSQTMLVGDEHKH